MRDIARFIRMAHDRGLRVITELVLNHTSDQHPWFQRARRAPAGSRWRDFYVWSDDPQRYREARIIFKDFETSNWSWDPIAQQYYWHRFYSHQPDLNFDNPEVRRVLTGDVRLLDEDGRGRPAARRHPVPLRARRHQLREPRRDARLPEGAAQAHRRQLPEPDVPGRGQPVARGRARVLRRGRRVPHGVPLPADAAPVHGDPDGGPLPDHRHPRADAGDPRRLPVGPVPAQPRRADARDGHRRGARLHVPGLRARAAGADQPGHPSPAGAAAGQRPGARSS